LLYSEGGNGSGAIGMRVAIIVSRLAGY
jgi:hypothetical protein